ncbi:hypothetical protein CCU68_31690 [Pseudomonas gingeri NCPPB 3146 = LMG 5327]|uniref:DUF1534 domain-containing protein n=1 Tax=Pseudomonas gingeri NCPPB 3146 = LMG 5327 TaxID=707248 RepID=A0ABX4XTF8_9PSED|nr:hypothetical protein CCU68_31690 [Pseudomonas gingeri NCPPB 3146 = LMG 5327]
MVPTLRVGTHPMTLRVALHRHRALRRLLDAERPGRHSHAERGNDQKPASARDVFIFTRETPV